MSNLSPVPIFFVACYFFEIQKCALSSRRFVLKNTSVDTVISIKCFGQFHFPRYGWLRRGVGAPEVAAPAPAFYPPAAPICIQAPAAQPPAPQTYAHVTVSVPVCHARPPYADPRINNGTTAMPKENFSSKPTEPTPPIGFFPPFSGSGLTGFWHKSPWGPWGGGAAKTKKNCKVTRHRKRQEFFYYFPNFLGSLILTLFGVRGGGSD